VSQLFNSFKKRAIHERKACDTPKLSEDEKLICEQQNSLRNIPRCAGYEKKEQREEPLLNETMNVNDSGFHGYAHSEYAHQLTKPCVGTRDQAAYRIWRGNEVTS
jgi:hypothetical protein